MSFGMRVAGDAPVRWLVLGASLYAVQGVVVAYLFNFNKSYMQSAGLPVDVIGRIQTFALLPLVFKFLVGPISDRFNLLGFGHRLPYIVLGLIVQAGGLVGLARLDPRNQLSLFTMMAMLTVVGLAIYDTCCDGLIIDVTPPENRARAQGLLWTSRFLAATFFTLGFGWWIDALGGARHADYLLIASAGLTLLPCGLALCLREPTRAADFERFKGSALKVMTRPWSLKLLAFGCLYGITGMGVESNLSLHYKEMGFGPGGDVGTLGAARNLGHVAGALMLPLAMARWGRRTVLILGVVILAGSIAAQVPVRGKLGAGAAGMALGAAVGWDDTLFATLAMEGADPRLAASTFALFMAVTNLSVVGDALFSAGVAASGGFHVPFFTAAIATLFALPLAIKLARSARVSPVSSKPDIEFDPGARIA